MRRLYTQTEKETGLHRERRTVIQACKVRKTDRENDRQTEKDGMIPR